MRLTADLINSSLSYLSPLKERELDLRGHKIPTIENLGVAGPQDAIDFTDNDITTISNFPLSPRLSTLLLARNRVAHIQPNLAESLPNLSTLVLSANNISELVDVDPLRRFDRLTHLSLIENPVTRKENYRYWLIWRIPTLRFLDFQKVKDTERQQAKVLFGTTTEPTALASKITGIKSRTFEVSNAVNGRGPSEKTIRVKLTETETTRVQDMIKNAKTMHEIARIEKDINEGRIPAGAADSDRMNM